LTNIFQTGWNHQPVNDSLSQTYLNNEHTQKITEPLAKSLRFFIWWKTLARKRGHKFMPNNATNHICAPNQELSNFAKSCEACAPLETFVEPLYIRIYIYIFIHIHLYTYIQYIYILYTHTYMWLGNMTWIYYALWNSIKEPHFQRTITMWFS
jgi:hypothetical protein